MRTITRALAVIGLTVLMAGCVPSLHPLFTKEEITFDPKLVGTWAEAGEKEAWTFQKSEGNAYEVIFKEEAKQRKLEAHLVQLGKFLFLDLYPKEPDLDDLFHIPAHTFVRIKREGDALYAAMLDPGWLEEMITQKKTNIAHQFVNNGHSAKRSIVLTAPTKELQDFVVKYAEDSKAFPLHKFQHKK